MVFLQPDNVENAERLDYEKRSLKVMRQNLRKLLNLHP
jgi:hypothetical protein